MCNRISRNKKQPFGLCSTKCWLLRRLGTLAAIGNRVYGLTLSNAECGYKLYCYIKKAPAYHGDVIAGAGARICGTQIARKATCTAQPLAVRLFFGLVEHVANHGLERVDTDGTVCGREVTDDDERGVLDGERERDDVDGHFGGAEAVLGPFTGAALRVAQVERTFAAWVDDAEIAQRELVVKCFKQRVRMRVADDVAREDFDAVVVCGVDIRDDATVGRVGHIDFPVFRL